MANKHMKRCSTSAIIREVESKTTMRYHLRPVRMGIIEDLKINTRDGVGEKGNSLTILVKI